MDERLLTLQLFCSNLSFSISSGKPVQGGTQYNVINGSDVVYVTLYDTGRCFARGANCELLTLLKVWCDNTFLNGMLHPDFAASWREWNTNARFVYDFHQQNGIPDEATAPEEYKQNREIFFHDYMFSSNRHIDIQLEKVEFTVKNWIKRFCFMNISAERVMDKAYNYLQHNQPLGFDGKTVPFSLAAEMISVAFTGYCSNKFLSCGKHCLFKTDMYECLKELVDMMYVYCEGSKIIAYNKTNLNKLLSGKESQISWVSLKPNSPIEEKMQQALVDAGLLSVPQYQAFAPKRRYRIDYLIPTPNGGRLAIECDGLQYHATPSAYVSDRQRDNSLICEGIIPVRFSSVDIENDIEGCINTIEKIFGEYQTGKRIYYRNGGISYFCTD